MATHHHGRKDDPIAALAPVLTCTATARSGQGCRQPAIPGGTVCRFHGGSAPQVREAARRRLLALVPGALATLEDMLTADSEAVRVRAAIDLLDRAGLKPATELAVSQQEAPNASLDAAILDALRARGLGAQVDAVNALPDAVQEAPDLG